MVLNSGKLDFAYTEPYKILRRAVEETNGSKIAENPTFMENIFELKDFSDITAKMKPLGVDCSLWLARWDDFRTMEIESYVFEEAQTILAS